MLRHLVLVLGDQLDEQSAALDGFDPARDAVWMAEVSGESTHVWNHKARVAVFLSAMRHFRDLLRNRGWTVHYRAIGDDGNRGTLADELASSLVGHRPSRLIMVASGEWRVAEALRRCAKTAGVPLEIRRDRHFLCSPAEFETHASGRKQLRMEFFYREMRRRHHVLMDGDQPAGGAWNYDASNRAAFGKSGPQSLPTLLVFAPDTTTRDVLREVERHFPGHPGALAAFDWPVTREDALLALGDFIRHRLPHFGTHQDAMWNNEDHLPLPGGARQHAYLFHSRLSVALNLKLLNPREVIAAAETAWRTGHAPLEAVEGFIRQILGWREYVRGIYWRYMPEYIERNALEAKLDLPAFYWNAQTDMRCLRLVIRQTLELGYAHHIQRLMVTGLFALLLGVRPKAVHEWYLAVYVDAVEWVELPNTLGMSQFADGGVMASKPYVASGKYIQRMSNYCEGCRFNPSKATGEDACPFTTLYWDFLMRHETTLASNPRMTMQFKNLGRLNATQRRDIRAAADRTRSRV